MLQRWTKLLNHIQLDFYEKSRNTIYFFAMYICTSTVKNKNAVRYINQETVFFFHTMERIAKQIINVRSNFELFSYSALQF